MIRVLALLFILTVGGCSGTQHPHTWIEKTDAAISVAAHALNAADEIVARRYTAEHQMGLSVASLEVRYGPIERARNIVRTRLISAERTLTAGGCPTVVAIGMLTEALTDLALVMGSAGFDDAAGVTGAVASLGAAVAEGPVCQ